VLVAEDDQDLAAYFADVLTDSGFEVHTAPNSPAALLAIGRTRPDAVLADLMMPGGGGMELLRVARQRHPDLPVVLVTGAPDTESAIEAMELGALHYLRKPVAAQEIVRAVNHAVERRRRRRDEVVPAGAGIPGEDIDLIEEALSRALSSAWLAYQPVLDVRCNSTYGHEALLRTRERSFTSPQAILEAAERLGRMQEVGRRMRRELAGGLDLGLTPADQVFFLNLHPHDLFDDDLFDASAGLSIWASRVVLDITGHALAGFSDVRDRLATLRELGYRIALDDIGGGHASLAALLTLKPEIVKIDTDLVSGIEASPVQQGLVRSVVALSRELSFTVVAKGVEKAAQRDVLLDLGVDLMQGFLFQRPQALLRPEPSSAS